MQLQTVIGVSLWLDTLDSPILLQLYCAHTCAGETEFRSKKELPSGGGLYYNYITASQNRPGACCLSWRPVYLAPSHISSLPDQGNISSLDWCLLACLDQVIAILRLWALVGDYNILQICRHNMQAAEPMLQVLSGLWSGLCSVWVMTRLCIC